jgi:hypothetical protein
VFAQRGRVNASASVCGFAQGADAGSRWAKRDLALVGEIVRLVELGLDGKRAVLAAEEAGSVSGPRHR